MSPFSPFCFTSTEVRWLIRDADRGKRGWKSEGLTVDTTWKRPERPWTATRTMEVLRQCPLAIAQWLVHCAIAVSTAVLGQSHKDNVRCTTVAEQPEVKEIQLSQPSSTSLLMTSSGLRVQLHLPPLDLAWNPVMVVKWCLMSSDVSWHIRDKLQPMLKYSSIILYVHGNQKARKDRQPRMATSTLTQLLNCNDLVSCCFTSTEARWPIRDRDRVGRGWESERLDCGNRLKKTGETVDRCQNNRSVKAVSPRHCTATCALRNCWFNCCAEQ